MYHISAKPFALEALNYRQFILAVLSRGKTHVPRGRLSIMARKSSLAKSYCSELMKGKRQLTTSSYLKILQGLCLPKELSRYFLLLVASEVRNIRDVYLGSSKAQIDLQISQFRMRHHNGNAQKDEFNKTLSLEIFYIYAALGNLSTGASLDHILKKTRIDPKKVQAALDQLLLHSWVKKQDEHYFACDSSIELTQLGENHSFLNAYAQSCKDLAMRSLKSGSDPMNKFFLTVLPIIASKSIEFRNRAQALLIQLADEFQEDSGEELVRVTLGICD